MIPFVVSLFLNSVGLELYYLNFFGLNLENLEERQLSRIFKEFHIVKTPRQKQFGHILVIKNI